MPVEPYPGIRNGTHAFYGRDGHAYHINKFVNGGRVSMRCAFYVSKQCKGRASCTRNGRDFKQTQPHNHLTEPETKEARRFRAAVMARCRADGITPLKRIHNEEKRRLGTSREAVALYPYVRLRSSMLRARYSLLPRIPHTLDDLREVLKDQRFTFLTQTIDGRDNLYAGTYGRSRAGTRCMLFASKRQLRYLRKMKTLFCDATFGSVPARLQVRQIWNISTVRRKKVIPLVRVLMQRKTQACYSVALTAIQQLARGLEPRSVNLDFEKGQKKAWKRAFRHCRRRGCLFHFTKNVIKSARKLGLTREIRQDEEVARLVRMVCAIPLLPTNLLEDGLHAVGRMAIRRGRFAVLQNFLMAMAGTWLAPSVMEVLSVKDTPHRTSNVCESDNATLAGAVGAPHPNIWKFLSGVVEVEDCAMQDLATIRAGGTPSRSRRASALANDARIKAFTEDFDEGNMNVATFLRRVSRRLQGAINHFVGQP